MKTLVTGSAGHLGEALVRTLRSAGSKPFGIDIKPSPFTDRVGSIANRDFVRECLKDVTSVLHTATLHKPHVATHTRQDFINTNVTGTLNLLEESTRGQVSAFVYTSTTSTFGDAMVPPSGSPAVWVNEELQSKPKNIYGVTKSAAEDLCQLFSRNQSLPCIVLRTSRFFPEEDDNREQRTTYPETNLKINELLFRRVDIEDVVSAHQLALAKCGELKFARFIISATTPFSPTDAHELGFNMARVVNRYVPDYEHEYRRRGWTMFPQIGRVYDNSRARQHLAWSPKYTFKHAIRCLAENRDYRSRLTSDIGCKGYHDTVFEDGPFPIES